MDIPSEVLSTHAIKANEIFSITPNIKFINGILYQMWQGNQGTITWEKVPSERELISLEESDRKVLDNRKKIEFANGIACPDCGLELVDVRGFILASDPPQINVRCPHCDYKGTRFIH